MLRHVVAACLAMALAACAANAPPPPVPAPPHSGAGRPPAGGGDGSGVQLQSPDRSITAAPLAAPGPQSSSGVTATPMAAASLPGAGANGPLVKVALLLPLTGKNQALGQAMLDAANLAVFDVAGKNFELLPEDTGDTPEKAKQAAQHAIAGGAKLILGPVFANAVASVRPLAKSSGLEVVSFSTDVTQAGDNVFVMGFVPQSQVARVAQFAMNRGLAQVAVLAPDTPYGNTAVAALQAASTSPVSVARYKTAADAPAALQTLAAATPQALLLPEGGEKLRAIAAALPASGLDPHRVQLLGTGLWDDPAIGHDPALVGGWFAGTAPAARADFERRFDATYHYKPERLATLAYDATALAVVLARQAPAGQNPYNLPAITKDSGFSGVDGVFRFNTDGVVDRELAVLQVGAAGPTVIDPAPASFPARTGM